MFFYSNKKTNYTVYNNYSNNFSNQQLQCPEYNDRVENNVDQCDLGK